MTEGMETEVMVTEALAVTTGVLVVDTELVVILQAATERAGKLNKLHMLPTSI